MTPGESFPVLLKIGFNGNRNSPKEGITGAVRGLGTGGARWENLFAFFLLTS